MNAPDTVELAAQAECIAAHDSAIASLDRLLAMLDRFEADRTLIEGKDESRG